MSDEGRDLANEIGVMGGVREVLVPVVGGPGSPDSKLEGRGFDFRFDESIEVSEFWIEVAPPNESVALLLSKGSTDAAQLKEHDSPESSPIFLNCEDFRRTYDELIDRGANSLAAPARMPFGWLSMFEDAEGRRFVLGQW